MAELDELSPCNQNQCFLGSTAGEKKNVVAFFADALWTKHVEERKGACAHKERVLFSSNFFQ
jgi:hypothetical protein